MRIQLGFLATATLFVMVGCGNSGEVDACAAKGVAYFKEVGAYPTLQSDPDKGRRAEDVARERCGRTTTAF